MCYNKGINTVCHPKLKLHAQPSERMKTKKKVKAVDVMKKKKTPTKKEKEIRLLEAELFFLENEDILY